MYCCCTTNTGITIYLITKSAETMRELQHTVENLSYVFLVFNRITVYSNTAYVSEYNTLISQNSNIWYFAIVTQVESPLLMFNRKCGFDSRKSEKAQFGSCAMHGLLSFTI